MPATLMTTSAIVTSASTAVDQLDAQRSALGQFPDGPPEPGEIACPRHLELST